MVTQFFERAGGRIAYEVSGAGPLVLCVPGMGELRGSFRYLAPQLVEAGYRVAQMDVRGHGESSVGWPEYSVSALGQDVLALLAHLGGGPAALIGNSMGAAAAVWAAAQQPDVTALVLLGPAVRGSVPGWMSLLFKGLFARPWGPAMWKAYYKMLYPSRFPADYADYSTGLARNMAEAGRLEALQGMMLESKAESAARLHQVQAPALVVMGSKDPDFKKPDEEARWVADQLHGRCVMVNGAGHYPQTEMPEVSGPVILEFLNAHLQEKQFANRSEA